MRTPILATLCSLMVASACIPDDGQVIPRIGNPAIEYPAATLEGDTVTLASLEGKVVLLNFWATWCVPCREETPYLQALYEEHSPEGLEVVGISLDTGDAAGALPERCGRGPFLVRAGLRRFAPVRTVARPGDRIDRPGCDPACPVA